MKQPIKDNYGKTIGYFDDAPNGKTKVTDHNGRTLGYYDPSRHCTTDHNGRKIGEGNQLMRLL